MVGFALGSGLGMLRWVRVVGRESRDGKRGGGGGGGEEEREGGRERGGEGGKEGETTLKWLVRTGMSYNAVVFLVVSRFSFVREVMR